MMQQTVTITGPGSPAPCRSTLNPSAREWFPPGYTAVSSEQSREQHDPAQAQAAVNSDAVFPVYDCPMEILSSVVGFLGSPQDLVSCILASQQLQAAVRSGRVSFELTGRPRQLLSYPSKSGQLDDLLQSLIRYMPAMSSCNLSMLPLEHQHVSKLAQGLPLLQHLDLSGCKKLQPSMTPQLLHGLASRQLQSLNLQRCFQLTDACLTGVLEYACGSHSSSKALQCVALSHLNLGTWPAAADAAGAQTASQHDADNSNNTLETASSCSSDGGSSQAAATSCDNNRASSNSSGSSGSTAVQWQATAAGLLIRLPRQLGVALPGAGAASALRVVVLNNCSLLPVEGLLSLAVACPLLEYLFLGGSTLKPPALLPAAAADGADAQGAEGSGVYVPRFAASGGASAGAVPAFELPAALLQLSELLQLPSTLPWEVLSSCCGGPAGSCSSGCGQQCCSCPCSCCSSARASAQNRGGPGSEGQDPEQERARKRLHRNEPSAAAVATARVHALGLAYLAALLPGLKVFEVSFMAPGLAGWLRVCLDKLQQLRQQQQRAGWSAFGSSSMGPVHGDLERVDSSSSSGSARSSSGGSSVAVTGGHQRPKVWQFSCVTSAADALQTLSDARRASSTSSATPSAVISGDDVADFSSSAAVSPSCLSMAVRCAVNCSNRGRGTPLHMAADAGCACHIRALLAAGAAVAARDASGASPLFVACESGQAAAAAVLLEAGADALMGNTAGETPLYIAALRGHLSVVELLLGHLAAADVDWTQRQLYGDAWTPLMAAAVANRVSVAMCLLHAAAMGCCGSKQRAAGGTGNAPVSFTSTTSSSSSSSSSVLTPWRSATAGSCYSYNFISSRPVQQLGRGSGGSSPGVVRLLAAENRYGQTVLHIAARKGCRELLQLLLLYGAGRVAGGVADAAGDTPLDIARRHGHEMAVRELMQQC